MTAPATPSDSIRAVAVSDRRVVKGDATSCATTADVSRVSTAITYSSHLVAKRFLLSRKLLSKLHPPCLPGSAPLRRAP